MGRPIHPPPVSGHPVGRPIHPPDGGGHMGEGSLLGRGGHMGGVSHMGQDPGPPAWAHGMLCRQQYGAERDHPWTSNPLNEWSFEPMSIGGGHLGVIPSPEMGVPHPQLRVGRPHGALRVGREAPHRPLQHTAAAVAAAEGRQMSRRRRSSALMELWRPFLHSRHPPAAAPTAEGAGGTTGVWMTTWRWQTS